MGHLKKRYFYYHCSKGCHYRLRADKVNTQFYDALHQLIPDPYYIKAFKIILRETYFELYEKKTIDQAHIIKAMEQMIDRIVRAKDALHSGAIDSEDFTAIKHDCEKRINNLGIQLQRLTALQLSKAGNLERLSKAISEIGSIYENANQQLRLEIPKGNFTQKSFYVRSFNYASAIA